MQINAFSQGKKPDLNEDFFGSNNFTVVVADGATDKSGRTYSGQTGGEIASRLVVRASLDSQLVGVELVRELNAAIASRYEQLGVLQAAHNDAKSRFSCSVVVARIVGDALIITSVGDAGFRVNGSEVHQDIKQVDVDNALKRAEFIEETGDVQGAREHILPDLLAQFAYQNNGEHSLGYGVVDGTTTPDAFVHVDQFLLDDVQTLELFTDGYFALPEKAEIAAWEDVYERVEKEDPYKYKNYKSTKNTDDRTVIVAKFG